MSAKHKEAGAGWVGTSGRSKYIILREAGQEVPVVFSPLLSHELIAGKRKVESAGFCTLTDTGRWKVSGRSESLRANARPEDAEILNLYLFL